LDALKAGAPDVDALRNDKDATSRAT